MKPLVMFRNVTCVVRCCLNLDDDTDGADGPVQQTPAEERERRLREFLTFSPGDF